MPLYRSTETDAAPLLSADDFTSRSSWKTRAATLAVAGFTAFVVVSFFNSSGANPAELGADHRTDQLGDKLELLPLGFKNALLGYKFAPGVLFHQAFLSDNLVPEGGCDTEICSDKMYEAGIFQYVHNCLDGGSGCIGLTKGCRQCTVNPSQVGIPSEWLPACPKCVCEENNLDPALCLQSRSPAVGDFEDQETFDARMAAVAAAPPAAQYDETITNVLNDPVGTPIQCTGNDVGQGANAAVYRYMGGNGLRWYPNPPIALSYDSAYMEKLRYRDCKNLFQGKFIPHNVQVGSSVQCTANHLSSNALDVYRVAENDVIRRYPDPTIASSWDPNWSSFQRIDCIGLTLGNVMPHNVQVGSSVQCTANDPNSNPTVVYRVAENDVLQRYPNPTIASSWDPNWGSPQRINCIGFTQGGAMTQKQP
jgi:hypothetical protein